jgi:hypothetical protein
MLEAAMLWVLVHFWAVFLAGGFALLGLKWLIDRLWTSS